MRRCGYCGLENATVLASDVTDHFIADVYVCEKCAEQIRRFPEACDNCARFGVPLVSIETNNFMDERATYELCPKCYDDYNSFRYRIVVYGGEDVASEGYASYFAAVDEVILLRTQPDMHRYFPLVIEKYNDWNERKVVATIEL